MHRDGIHFQGLRYLDPTLAAYVGEAGDDPLMTRATWARCGCFTSNRFLCRAVSPRACREQEITLKDIQAARTEPPTPAARSAATSAFGPLVDLVA